MVTLVAYARIKDSRREDALAAFAKIRTPSQQEEGCNQYDFYESPTDHNFFVFVEEWASREALEAHFQQPHFVEYSQTIPDMLAEPPMIRIYDIAGYEDLVSK